MEYGSKREIVARMKSHKGKPKPQTGFGFPQHLRERKKERKTSPTNIPTTKEKKERTTNTKANNGVRSWRATNQTTFQPQRRKSPNKYPTAIPDNPNKKPATKPTKSRRTCHRRVEGPMGRPALLGSHPRGPQYRGVTSTPPLREPPLVAQKADNLPDTSRLPQKLCPST